MTDCAICNAKLVEKALYCHTCGTRVDGAADERAWIVAMQERIRTIRQNGIFYNIVAVIGLLIALSVPFVMRFVLLFNMNWLSLLITGIGAALFAGSMVVIWSNGRKVKELILILQQGQPAEPGENKLLSPVEDRE